MPRVGWRTEEDCKKHPCCKRAPGCKGSGRIMQGRPPKRGRPSMLYIRQLARAAGILARARAQTQPSPEASSMIVLTVNGTRHELDIEPETPLLWALRDEIGLTGTKIGRAHV